MNEYNVTVYIANGRNGKEINRTVEANSTEEAAGYIYNLLENEEGETIVDDILVYPQHRDEPERFPN